MSLLLSAVIVAAFRKPETATVPATSTAAPRTTGQYLSRKPHSSMPGSHIATNAAKIAALVHQLHLEWIISALISMPGRAPVCSDGPGQYRRALQT